MKIASNIYSHQISTKKTLKNNCNNPTYQNKKITKLSSNNIRDYYATQNNINFSGTKVEVITDKTLAKIFENLDTPQNIKSLVDDIYTKLAKYMNIKNVTKENLLLENLNKQKQGKYRTQAIFKEAKCQTIIDKESLNQPKIELIKNIAHELEHTGQFSLMHRKLGDEKFAELLSKKDYILTEYDDKILKIKKTCPKIYLKRKQSIAKLILEDVKACQTYQKNKDIPLSSSEDNEALRLIKAFRKYRPENYKNYKNNPLEITAREMEEFISSEYEYWQQTQ